MGKMVKSARGEMVDWELLNIQASTGNNVAQAVEVVNPVEQAARKRMKANMEKAKQMMKQKIQDDEAAKARAVLASLEVGMAESISVVETPTDAPVTSTKSTKSYSK